VAAVFISPPLCNACLEQPRPHWQLSAYRKVPRVLRTRSFAELSMKIWLGSAWNPDTKSRTFASLALFRSVSTARNSTSTSFGSGSSAALTEEKHPAKADAWIGGAGV